MIEIQILHNSVVYSNSILILIAYSIRLSFFITIIVIIRIITVEDIYFNKPGREN